MDAMLHTELAQARQMAARAMQERETYIRIVALLVKAIETQTEAALVRVDGHIAIRAEAFAEVPQKYTVGVRDAKVTDKDDPSEKEMDVVVVTVADAKPRSTLVVPNGVAR